MFYKIKNPLHPYMEFDEENERNFDIALANLDKAIKLKENNAEFYKVRGEINSEKCDYDNSIIDFNKAITLQPRNAHLYSLRGISYSEKFHHQYAIKDLKECLKLSLNNQQLGQAYFLIAVSYFYMGNADKAIIYCEKAEQAGYTESENISTQSIKKRIEEFQKILPSKEARKEYMYIQYLIEDKGFRHDKKRINFYKNYPCLYHFVKKEYQKQFEDGLLVLSSTRRYRELGKEKGGDENEYNREYFIFCASKEDNIDKYRKKYSAESGGILYKLNTQHFINAVMEGIEYYSGIKITTNQKQDESVVDVIGGEIEYLPLVEHYSPFLNKTLDAQDEHEVRIGIRIRGKNNSMTELRSIPTTKKQKDGEITLQEGQMPLKIHNMKICFEKVREILPL